MQKNNRNTELIAKNTVFLYLRSILVMFIGIYTSRIVLQILGIDDYGIYNVIGGFVAMFSILSTSLVNASQRFISYEMGKELPNLRRVFCVTVSIHILLALVVLVAFETIGIWFLNTKLNISPDRINAANWVFQCSVITFCINLISVPYNASIIAHEKMSAFAYISIFEAISKLGIVYLLKIFCLDKLILYSVLMLLIAGSLRFVYGIYCSRNFEECHFRFMFDKPLIREMLSFTGWNFIGSTAGILCTHGINILINIFFGVVLNAARGVADQVSNAINSFVNNFMVAVNPQITKSYASGDFIYMNKLMARGSKYATLLYWLIALTFFVDTENILTIWLVDVPAYAPVFLRLTIIYSIFQALSNTLYIGMLATGNIKKYQIVMGSLYIGSFILCYFFFTIGLGPSFGYISTIITVFIGMFVRLKLLAKIISDFSIKDYLNETVVKTFIVIFASTGFLFLCKFVLPFGNKYSELFVMLFLSVITVIVLSLLIALDNSEKLLLLGKIKKILKR